MKYLFLNRTMERIIINRFAAEKTDNDTRSDRIYGTQKRHKGKRPEELFYFSHYTQSSFCIRLAYYQSSGLFYIHAGGPDDRIRMLRHRSRPALR